jgi:hypothetical protein
VNSLFLKNIPQELRQTQRFEGDGFSWIPQQHVAIVFLEVFTWLC